ncbi:GPW/gp25 family protein [Polluticaenibacter yanchengensis]|uniref:GPW/gp25 family protein n=1 Tax=Polluticaenibacter yanchengensis TaxID=3014562 RepID=A0ABT4UFZ9_9BACT|nr:GPW/gp25 family protein [Chitinophagaceae bacterium LY-5]
MEYLKLPLLLEPFFEQQPIATCNMESSVMRFLHLLITTAQEEFPVDEQFGLSFWDEDYSTHITSDLRREQLVHHLLGQIERYEKRLAQVEVDVNIKNNQVSHQGVMTERRRVEIIVKARLTHSLEPFSFYTGFFIGPFNMD